MHLFISNKFNFTAAGIGSNNSTMGNFRVNLGPNVTVGLGRRFDLITGYNFLKCGSSCVNGNFNFDTDDRSLAFKFRCRFWSGEFRQGEIASTEEVALFCFIYYHFIRSTVLFDFLGYSVATEWS